MYLAGLRVIQLKLLSLFSLCQTFNISTVRDIFTHPPPPVKTPQRDDIF